MHHHQELKTLLETLELYISLNNKNLRRMIIDYENHILDIILLNIKFGYLFTSIHHRFFFDILSNY